VGVATALAQKHAEFTQLFEAFTNTYLDREVGQEHLRAYTESREAAHAAFAAIRPAHRAGRDVTDAVLAKLLPYADTPANREAGRWISVAPALTGDVRTKYEAAGWTDPEAWPQVAEAVFALVRRCVEHPDQLPDACAEFAAHGVTKGFQVGTVSPILNALRPDDFVIASTKSRQVINYVAGTAYGPDLMDYPDVNATAFALIDALSPAMHTLDVREGRDVDLFDAFCHWLVTVRTYDFRAPEPLPLADFTTPFSRIFAGREEAEWALDLMRATLVRLGVEGPGDRRVAVTLPDQGRRSGGAQGRTLRLNFGNWAVLQFYGPCYRQFRVGLALMEEHLDVAGAYVPWRRFAVEDDVSIRVYDLPIEAVRLQDSVEHTVRRPRSGLPVRAGLRRPYERALDYAAAHFRDWRASNYRRFHQPEIAAAVFDMARRDRLFTEGFCDATAPVPPAADRGAPAPAVAREVAASYAVAPESSEPYSLSRLSEETGIEEATVARWVRAIDRKGQAILYGPPGTGKTFLAERLARHLVGGGDGLWSLIQFHPAYAYEDFVQGLRPHLGAGSTGDAGRLAYEMVPGRLMAFCDEARHRTGRSVLILDEINRADLARVFGEVMYVLEYRDRAIPLAGGGTFSLPAQVRLLGTMNTADRSIALVDHALRRRFAFIPVWPDYDVLRRYHARRATGFAVEPLIDLLATLNRQIGDPHYHVGITYFLQEELGEHLAAIWEMEIVPYLEEYFFDQPDKVEAFRWSQVRHRFEGGG
jgi:5-methylcytosine-specific restriction protein B